MTDGDTATVESDGAGNDDALFRKLSKQIKADIDAQSDWLKQAEEDYDFVSGNQWDAQTLEKLREEKRPAVVFNRISPAIRAASGTEMSNPLQTTFKAPELGDTLIVEVWNQAARWAREGCDAQDEESDIFLDALICGMGWGELRMDFEESPRGKPSIERISPMEVFADANATKRNLVDSRRISHVKRVPLSEAREMFPGKKDEDLDAAWARHSTDMDRGVSRDSGRRYDEMGTGDGAEERHRHDDTLVTLVRCQWKERVRVVEVQDPNTGQPIDVPEGRFQAMQRAVQATGVPLRGRPKSKTVYRQAYIGRTILRQGDAPFQTGFSFECVTGFRDQMERSWYGLVRSMKDPQRYANKWLSSAMQQMAVGPKGGAFLERSAVENQRDFEKTYADPSKVTFLRDGAIKGGKIMPKPPQTFPAGAVDMMQFAIDSVREVSGVSQEMMGTREVDQPGVLEQQRRTQGVVMLNTLLTSLRRYRKRSGRRLLELFQRYIDPQRMARIIGEGIPQQVVQAAYQADIEYDVTVDETPTSASQKELVWALISPVWQTLPPQVQSALWDYSPFPATVVEKIKQGYQAALEPPPPDPKAEEQADADIAKTHSEATENAARAARDRAEAAKTEMEMQLPMLVGLPSGGVR